MMSKTHQPESAESNSDAANRKVETDDLCREERLAAMLLRLLGVYFLALAFITGIDEVVRLFVELRMSSVGLDDILPKHWAYWACFVAEFAVGAYLLIGGQWVFEKVLIPIISSPGEDNQADVDDEAMGDPEGTDNSPGRQDCP